MNKLTLSSFLQALYLNRKQLLVLLRAAATFAGGMLVMHGVMTDTQFDSLINQIGTVLTDLSVLGGMLVPIVTAAWGMFAHSDAAAVKDAAAVPGVSVIVTPAADEKVKAAVPDLTKS
jgi:hypothetical protein